MAAASATRVMRTGKKEIFLPDHLITFLRPKDTKNQPPNFATFKVPLTFNKLDIRDYLRRAYDVATVGVRSQLRQQKPRRSRVKGGRIYRPPPIKTMTVELARPFVWPAAPEDRTPWVSDREERREKAAKNMGHWQRAMQRSGRLPMRDEQKMEAGRLSVQQEARRLLREGRWNNERVLDPKFGVQGGRQVNEGKGGEKEREKKKEKKGVVVKRERKRKSDDVVRKERKEREDRDVD